MRCFTSARRYRLGLGSEAFNGGPLIIFGRICCAFQFSQGWKRKCGGGSAMFFFFEKFVGYGIGRTLSARWSDSEVQWGRLNVGGAD
jgi:hypothetical protein